MIEQDIQYCATIAQQYRSTFGFISSAIVRDAAQRNRLVVVRDEHQRIEGWLRFGLHKTYTTISIICVAQPQRGIGTKLLQLFEQMMQNHFPRAFYIIAKCPVDEPANIFYKKCGFVCVAQIAGNRRTLNVWRKDITDVSGGGRS